MNLVKWVPGLLSLVVWLWVGAASAQETSFVQVEAQPTLAQAMDRARAYATEFSDVQGFRVASGWYAVVLGPMTADDAAARMVELRGQNLIPTDSFVTEAAGLGNRFWPVGGTQALGAGSNKETEAGVVAEPTAEPTAEPAAEPAAEMPAEAPPVVEETRAEALAAEQALPGEDRIALQEALQWYGFYDGTLDGAIGKGTRKSMAAWQEAQGAEPTGVLTTAQRGQLVGGWRSDKAEFGFDTVTDAEAGIEATLPLGLVQFDTYAPPFAEYQPKAGSGLTIRLISEPGDAAALAGLYDVLQTLDIMPEGGERSLEAASFTITGRSASLSSFAFAQAEKGAIKGYLVSWTPALDDKIGRILPVIRASFRANGAQALDPGLVPLQDAVRRGLMAGLTVKKPKSSQSGLYVSADGAVVTTASAVAKCGRITLERKVDADVAAQDAGAGLVLLKPRSAIAPQAFASFAVSLPPKGAQVAAVGWSYGDRLPAPVLNPGLLEDPAGLDGSAGQVQLALEVMPGDVGGPVLDSTGAVIGLVLPGNPNGPALPQGVTLAQTDGALKALMAQAALVPVDAASAAPATPDALQAKGVGMTALVGCWD
jgi:peptidoglycan hydrolase-like protein with peptidoglycan-binding domain